MRLLCRSLAAQLRRSVGETGELAASFGIGEEYLLECLSGFERIADPLAVLRGEQPPMPDALLAKDVRLVAEMARRAGLELGGLRSAEEAYKSMDPMEYR